ncbi:MAG TPA: ATP-dependent sacrificial sulfur transferase LarE [Candidatus Eisenbacteria bacterium]|nr:ATP-dependent sacrificial sulfur transferase LarE [Candidatus Eisenbacteria bacterium]
MSDPRHPGLTLRGPGIDPQLQTKRDRLGAILGSLGQTVVAYSGGVDSAFLLVEAKRVLGDRAEGAIADSPSLPRSELDQAIALAEERGIRVRIIVTQEMERDAYVANGPDRCYHCKAELFGCLEAMAETEGWATIAYGAVTDDLGDVRPGMRAADRYQVRAPLLEAGLGKLEVRVLARSLGLPVWDKPQSACLASRIPHGSPVTREKLRQVEQGEAWLRGAFDLRVVRLRHEGDRARIEVGLGEIARISTDAAISRIRQRLGALGFQDVWIDPAGYRRADPSPS